MKLSYVVASAALAFASNSALAVTPILDGNYDSVYGAPTASSTYVPGAPTSNFFTPTPANDTSNYSIYLTTDANYIYGLLRSATATGNNFANLYFSAPGSDGSYLGFEITNDRAFIPGGNGAYASNLSGLDFAIAADGKGIEFRLANSLFTSFIPGLTYTSDAPTPLPAVGGTVTLRMSQSFGLSVVGGATYGDNRLGTVTLGQNLTGNVPEPASWAMMMAGFGLLGATLRRSRARLAVA